MVEYAFGGYEISGQRLPARVYRTVIDWVKDDEPKKHQRCTHALWAAAVCSLANWTYAVGCNPEIDL
jgi:hypothetical protein